MRDLKVVNVTDETVYLAGKEESPRNKRVVVIPTHIYEFVKTWLEVYPPAIKPNQQAKGENDPYWENGVHDKLVAIIENIKPDFYNAHISCAVSAVMGY